MRSNLEIFYEWCDYLETGNVSENVLTEANALNAMDEYAKEIAIGFQRWVNINYVQDSHGYYEYNYFLANKEYFTTEELYNIYLKTIEK